MVLWICWPRYWRREWAWDTCNSGTQNVVLLVNVKYLKYNSCHHHHHHHHDDRIVSFHTSESCSIHTLSQLIMYSIYIFDSVSSTICVLLIWYRIDMVCIMHISPPPFPVAKETAGLLAQEWFDIYESLEAELLGLPSTMYCPVNRRVHQRHETDIIIQIWFASKHTI